MEPPDPAFLQGDDVRAALTARDIGTVYRHLARLTGQSQPEVSEILRNRQVSTVWVLERIAGGLGIPRARLGVSYGEEKLETPPAQEEIPEKAKRRTLIATATTIVVGQALGGEPVELPLPSGQVMPSRLGMSHVHIARAVTGQLRGVARYYGGQAEAFGAAVTAYPPWLGVPAAKEVTAALAAALGELHTEAGWCCHGAGLDGTGHFTRALRRAGEARDVYGVANAALHAGVTLVRGGHPNDALKLFQLGQLHLRGFPLGRSAPAPLLPDDPRLPTVITRLSRQSATAWALMKTPQEATCCLAEANQERGPGMLPSARGEIS